MEARYETSFLQLPWEQLLPHLSPISLGQLACTCKQLCAVVDDADPRVWQHAALEILGPEHPVVASHSSPGCLTVPSMRAALQRQYEAVHNMKQTNYYDSKLQTDMNQLTRLLAAGVKVPWASHLQVSATGRHYAVSYVRPNVNPGIRVYSAASGQQTAFIFTPRGDRLLEHLRWSCSGEELRFAWARLSGSHEVHRASVSRPHSKLQHTFLHRILDLSPYGQYIKIFAHTVSGDKLRFHDFKSAEKVLELPSNTNTCWHTHDGAIAYTQWGGAAWDVHAVCLRTKSPLFKCSGPSGHLSWVAFVPCHAIVGFLKQKHGQQQAILMGTVDGGRMQLEVIYDSKMELDNIHAAPDHQFVAFQEREADTGHGVIVSADTKAICYRTVASHLDPGEEWRAAWSADSKWVIWYVSMTCNSWRPPCLLVDVATWHETQLFYTTSSIHCVLWNRDVCSVLVQTCDSMLHYDVLLLSFVRFPQTMTSLYTRMCVVAHRWLMALVCLMLLPCLLTCTPFLVICLCISQWRHLWISQWFLGASRR